MPVAGAETSNQPRERTLRTGSLELQLEVPAHFWTAPADRRIVRRMPRLQVYLPDDLYEALKSRDLPASELLQEAVRAELQRLDALDATDDYLTVLADEVGEPTSRQSSRAAAITRRIRNRQLNQAG